MSRRQPVALGVGLIFFISGLIMGVLLSGRVLLSGQIFLCAGVGSFAGYALRGYWRPAGRSKAPVEDRAAPARPIAEPVPALSVADDLSLADDWAFGGSVRQSGVPQEIFRAILDVSPQLGSLTRAVYGRDADDPAFVAKVDAVLLAYVQGLVAGCGLADQAEGRRALALAILSRCVSQQRVDDLAAAGEAFDSAKVAGALKVIESFGWDDGVQLKGHALAGEAVDGAA